MLTFRNTHQQPLLVCFPVHIGSTKHSRDITLPLAATLLVNTSTPSWLLDRLFVLQLELFSQSTRTNITDALLFPNCLRHPPLSSDIYTFNLSPECVCVARAKAKTDKTLRPPSPGSTPAPAYSIEAAAYILPAPLRAASRLHDKHSALLSLPTNTTPHNPTLPCPAPAGGQRVRSRRRPGTPTRARWTSTGSCRTSARARSESSPRSSVSRTAR